MLPSGEQVELRSGDYAAVVTGVGATLRSLAYRGRPLVRGFDQSELRPVYSGAVLAPWPNRIADGRYRYAGADHQLAINEPERATALHGLVAWAGWQVASRAESEVVLRHTLWPRTGYPFLLGLRMCYRLTGHGLAARLDAENLGTATAPYGCSIHTYLVAGDGPVDHWTLHLPAARYLEVNDRLLPTGEAEPAGSRYDFRTPRRIGDVTVDHAFTGIDFDVDGEAYADLTGPDGHGVRMRWDRTCPWVQVHTADRPEPGLNRTGLALEPMTCPPDAFRSGADVVHLEPGQTHTATWTLGALPR